MKLLFLFLTFVKIGLLSVGGGLATIPFLNELADNSDGWLTRELVANILAVSQSLPGAIGANCASYVGYLYASVPGSYISAISLTIPSIIIILVIARVYQTFKESASVKNVFSGLRPAAAGLLSSAAFGAISMSLWNSAAQKWFEYLLWKEVILFAAVLVLIIKLKKHPIVYIIGAGVIGIVLQL